MSQGLINQERLDITLSHYPGDGRNLGFFFPRDFMCIPVTLIMDYCGNIRIHRAYFFMEFVGSHLHKINITDQL